MVRLGLATPQVRLGTEEFDSASAVIVDKNGYIFVTGYLNETWDDTRKNAGVSSDAGRYTFLAKYTPDGQQVWLKTFESKTASQ